MPFTHFYLPSHRLLVEENALASALLRHILKFPVKKRLPNIYLGIPQLMSGYVF